MKKIAILLVAACLLLTGCLSAGINSTGQATTAPVPTTTAPAPTTTDPIPTTTPTDPVPTTSPAEPMPTTTDPVPTTEPTDPEIEKYQTLLGWRDDIRNPYNFALGCEFSNPKEVNLRYFFDYGLDGNHTPTEEEKAALKQYVGEEWVNAADWYRLTKDKMEAELQKYFGISLADLPDTAFDGLMYLESTDCYYFLATGSMFDYITVTVKSVNNNDDGTVSVTYTYGFEPYVYARIVTLKPNGDSYLILSNVKIE